MTHLAFIFCLNIQNQVSRQVTSFALGHEAIVTAHENKVFLSGGAHLRNDGKTHGIELVVGGTFLKEFFGVLGNLKIGVHSFDGLGGVDMFERLGVEVVHFADLVALV
jgi:hypothetical protein